MRQPQHRFLAAAHRTVLASLACALMAGTAQATARLDVVFDDPGAQYTRYYGDLERVTLAAGQAWMDSFSGLASNAELSVRIGFASMATASGRSTSSAWLGTGDDGLHLYEQGATHELLTGVDSNGSLADIEFIFGTDGYLQSSLWFDPEPTLRLAAVPAQYTDAVSVLLHEFGHALGFNGWRDGVTGDLPGNYQSTFDALVRTQPTAAGTGLFFTGTQSQSLYGAPLPLTQGNYGHLGNDTVDRGRDLRPDLMNGWVFYPGMRYDISPLDLLVMADLGMSLAAPVPEPGSSSLWLGGLASLGAVAWRQRARRSPARTAGV